MALPTETNEQLDIMMEKYAAACKSHERIRSEYSAYSLDFELQWKLTVSRLVVQVLGTQAVTAE